MFARLLLALLGWSTVSAVCGAEATADFIAAKALFDQKRYPEARPLWEKVVVAEPKNAEAFFYLGRTWAARGDNAAAEEAVKYLARAVELDPENPLYLGIYGGTMLQLASRTSSLSFALKGRDAMEKSVRLDPAYLDAHEGLVQFYQQAPWPIGSSAKAAAHLEEMRKHDPDRATALSVIARADARDYATAFKLCEDVLAKNTGNYIALYQFGRTAAASGQRLEQALERLQKCLTLEPPAPSSPSHSNVWQKIGSIQAQLKHTAEARAAYETALKLDPGNKRASDELANLK